MADRIDSYSVTYGSFASDLSAEIRREAFGEDIGQNSWTTAQEQLGLAAGAGLTPASHLLEVGCGSGGPALFLARSIGLSVTGIDINAAGIDAANQAATAAGLAERARFRCTDAGAAFPFGEASFDAGQITDAINHIPDRAALLAELHRVLKPGATLIYTDPVVITGPVTNDELALRSSIGFFVFVPPGENERLLGAAGFKVRHVEDRTSNVVETSRGRLEAREKRRAALVELEGQTGFDGYQAFLATVHALSSSGRLSRFAFIAERL